MPKRNPLKTFVYIHQKLAYCIQKKQNQNSVQRTLKQLIRLDPQNCHALFLYSKLLRTKQQPQIQLSKQCLQSAKQINPCFYYSNGITEENIVKHIQNITTQIIKFAKESNIVEKKWYEMLTMFSKKRDFSSCQTVLRLFEAFKEKKQQCSPQQLSTLGLVSYEAGNYLQSAQYYRAAIASRPGQYKYYNNLAILNCILEKYSQSIQLVQKSLQLNPGYAKSAFILSFSLCELNRHQQALQQVVSSVQKVDKSTMFRFKHLIMLLKHFSDRTVDIQKCLKQICLIMKHSDDKDSYFYIKENIPHLESFIEFVSENYQEAKIFGNKWDQYLDLMNQFLLKGHYHKYKLGGEMNTLKQVMKQNKRQLAQQSIKLEFDLVKLQTQTSQKLQISQQKIQLQKMEHTNQSIQSI